MITIYTTATCPKCKILKTKLNQKNIEYTEVADIEKLTALNITSVPQMQLDGGPLMSFVDANQWVNSQEGK